MALTVLYIWVRCGARQRKMASAKKNAVYGSRDILYEGREDRGRRITVEGAHALFFVDVPKSALRPHAKAICDAKDPDSSDIQLLLLFMHLVHNIGLCFVDGPKEEATAYFEHATHGKMRRIDVYYEHLIHPAHNFSVGLRYTFVVNDPLVDMAVGIAEIIRRNVKANAQLAEKKNRGMRKQDVDDEPEPPWKSYLCYTSLHDVAQAIDFQLRHGPDCIDAEDELLALELHDRNNPANPAQALSYARRYTPGGAFVCKYFTDEATGHHSLIFDSPYSRNVVHVAHRFSAPEIFFALPFCSVWIGTPRQEPDPMERLEATVRLRKRTEFQWKEFTDTEHLQREVAQYVEGRDLDDALRRECEDKFFEVMSSRASRLPLVVKTVLAGVDEDGDARTDPTPTHSTGVPLTGIDDFGRWLIAKFDAIYASGGIVAHLRHFLRLDIVAFSALRRARNMLAPFIISRGIAGSGKSMQREQCLKRHRNGKRCGHMSGKSRFVHDRDREQEIYFPLDGFYESFDEAPAHLTAERSGPEDREENSVEKEMVSSGMLSWEVLSSWGYKTKRRSTRGTVSCYIGRSVNSNKSLNFTASMQSRVRVQEFFRKNVKAIRRLVGTECNKEAKERKAHWYQQGHISERNIMLAHEFMRANPHDRGVDLTAAAQIADNFFDAMEAETNDACATARDKELFLVFCHCVCLWYYVDISCSGGGTALRYANGEVVQYVCTEAMAVAVLSLMDMEYVHEMDSKIAVAFSQEAHELYEGERGGKRRRTAKITDAFQQWDYVHAATDTGCYDERYAVVTNCSLTALAHTLGTRLHASVEQCTDALARLRRLTRREGGKQLPVLKAERATHNKSASVAVLVSYLRWAHSTVIKPHKKMKEILAKVLSYPSQKKRSYVTCWTLGGTHPKYKMAGERLLELLPVNAGKRELRVFSANGTVEVLGKQWTLDEMALYGYSKKWDLPYHAPVVPVGQAKYPGLCFQRELQLEHDARGTASNLREQGYVADAPAEFLASAGGGGAPTPMQVN